jgi:hypothetical protein
MFRNYKIKRKLSFANPVLDNVYTLNNITFNPKFKVTWDYLGYNYNDLNPRDWKNTLITRINQLSTQIHRVGLRGPANEVWVHKDTCRLFHDSEYFHVNYSVNNLSRVGILCGKYDVKITYNIPPDIIIVRRQLEFNDFLMCVGDPSDDGNYRVPLYDNLSGEIKMENFTMV